MTSTVKGTGTEQVISHSSVNGKGVAHMVVITAARGTATDTVGGSYRFNYLNNTKTVIQPCGFPQDLLIRDHFNLVGHGSANQVHTSFVIRVHVFGPGPNDFTVEVVKTDCPRTGNSRRSSLKPDRLATFLTESLVSAPAGIS